MTERIVMFEGDIHRTVQALLPWYVNDTLNDGERARVAAHLAGCSRCQAEERWERSLLAAHAAQATTADADAGLAQIHAAIARESATTAAVRGKRAAVAWHGTPVWMRWLLGGQCLVLLLLGLVLIRPPVPDAAYRALGAAPDERRANLIVSFRADAREEEIRQVLRAAGARIVDGPTEQNAYLLRVPQNELALALPRLRQASAVMLAEALEGAAQ